MKEESIPALQQMIDAVSQAIEYQNWYAALFICLSLPDICSSMDEKFSQSTQKGRYSAWFDRYIPVTFKIAPTNFTGEDCYYFRCQLLHKGVGHQEYPRGVDVVFVAPPDEQHMISLHMNRIGNTQQMRVDLFCHGILEAVCKWANERSPESQEVREGLNTLLRVYGPRELRF